MPQLLKGPSLGTERLESITQKNKAAGKNQENVAKFMSHNLCTHQSI